MQEAPSLPPQAGIAAAPCERAGASISIAPPLIINREEVDELVDMVDQAIGNLERELGLG